jgi:hypothetical protein
MVILTGINEAAKARGLQIIMHCLSSIQGYLVQSFLIGIQVIIQH